MAFAAVILVLTVVALLASWLPAHLATRIEPTVALRHE
jgi:ABC-type lipoprotein release transport system permease subunit